MRERCYVGLGSNLAEPAAQLRQAINSLQGHPDIHDVVASAFFGSTAIGPGVQSNYVNAAVALSTSLPPEALLDLLQTIETGQGRTRDIRWGARTLDLDLLLYGSRHISSERLTVPHPRMRERAFVLIPLASIAPDLVLPDGTCLATLLDYASTDDVWPLQSQDGV